MTVVFFGAAKGAPGVTTSVLALASRWPTHREPLVVEADPSGGDVLVRLASLDGNHSGLDGSLGTVQLAAAARTGLSERMLLEHLQRLPGAGEIRALVAPPSPFAACTALDALASAGLGALLRDQQRFDVLGDVGRIDATSPSLRVLRELGAVVLVARPALGSVLHTRELVASLAAMGVRSSLLLVGDRPYAPSDVLEATRAAAVVGVLPEDPVGAAALAGEARSAKTLARCRLIRAATEVATRLAPAPATPSPSSRSEARVAERSIAQERAPVR